MFCHEGEEDLQEERGVKWVESIQCYKGLNCLDWSCYANASQVYIKGSNSSYTLTSNVTLTLNKPRIRKFPRKVELCALDKGVFLFAKLCIYSDLPARAEVVCGKGYYDTLDLYRSVNVVELSLPVTAKNIRCSVFIEDVLGNKRRITKIFNLSSPFTLEEPKAIYFKAFFITANNKKFLCIETDGYGLYKVGIVNNTRPRAIKDHPPVDKGYKASLSKCYLCHPKGMLGLSHPIGVEVEKRNLIYAKLIDGKVTCTSCHDPHLSSYPYLLRERQTKLCTDCHGARYR